MKIIQMKNRVRMSHHHNDLVVKRTFCELTKANVKTLKNKLKIKWKNNLHLTVIDKLINNSIDKRSQTFFSLLSIFCASLLFLSTRIKIRFRSDLFIDLSTETFTPKLMDIVSIKHFI